MQLYAVVPGYAMIVAATTMPTALGAAIHAAVAAGAYPDVPTAAASMGRAHRDAYRPDPARHAAYTRLYLEYRVLHDYFGGRDGAHGGLLHRLRALRHGALSEAAPSTAGLTPPVPTPTSATGAPR
jgi:L-ribulokinase